MNQIHNTGFFLEILFCFMFFVEFGIRSRKCDLDVDEVSREKDFYHQSHKPYQDDKNNGAYDKNQEIINKTHFLTQENIAIYGQ